ncbi:MAG: hypothetical protein R3Y09_00575 [Clostridia bacterium]
MKKTIIVILAMSFLLLTACSTETTNTPTLESKGLELIAVVDTLAESEEYITLLSASPDLTDIIADIASGDYTTPKSVFIMEDLNEIILDSMVLLTGQTISDELYDLIKGNFANVIPSQINAMGGAYNLAATSLLAYADSFIYEGLTSTTTYLYTFDSNYCFMVSFVPNDENIVNASVTIVINEDLASADTTEQVEEFLISALSIEEVSVSMETEGR